LYIVEKECKNWFYASIFIKIGVLLTYILRTYTLYRFIGFLGG